MLPRGPGVGYRYLKSGIGGFIGGASWFRRIELQTALLLFDGCTTLVLWSGNWVALGLMNRLPKKRSLSSMTIFSIVPPGLL